MSDYKKTVLLFLFPENQMHQNQSVCFHFLCYSFVETVFKMKLHVTKYTLTWYCIIHTKHNSILNNYNVTVKNKNLNLFLLVSLFRGYCVINNNIIHNDNTCRNVSKLGFIPYLIFSFRPFENYTLVCDIYLVDLKVYWLPWYE